MSLLDDDKNLPTRHGSAIGGAAERQMLAKVGADSIRTVIRNNPDGSTTMLRTRNGFPEFTTTTPTTTENLRFLISFYGTSVFYKNGTPSPQPLEAAPSDKVFALLKSTSCDGVFQLYAERQPNAGKPSGFMKKDDTAYSGQFVSDPATAFGGRTAGSVIYSPDHLKVTIPVNVSGKVVSEWGNAFHGKITGTTLTRDDGGGSVTVSAPKSSWTWLTKFDGISDPHPNPPENYYDNPYPYRNYALFHGTTKRYNALGGGDIGRNCWLYRSPAGVVWRLTATFDFADNPNDGNAPRIVVKAESVGFPEAEVFRHTFSPNGTGEEPAAALGDNVIVQTGFEEAAYGASLPMPAGTYWVVLNHNRQGSDATLLLYLPTSINYYPRLAGTRPLHWPTRPHQFSTVLLFAQSLKITGGDSARPTVEVGSLASNYYFGAAPGFAYDTAMINVSYTADLKRRVTRCYGSDFWGGYIDSPTKVWLESTDGAGMQHELREITAQLGLWSNGIVQLPQWVPFPLPNNCIGIMTGPSAGAYVPGATNGRYLVFDPELTQMTVLYASETNPADLCVAVNELGNHQEGTMYVGKNNIVSWV